MSDNIDTSLSPKLTTLPFGFGAARARLWGSDFVAKVAQTYVAQVVSLALALVSTILITRALGPAGRGLYAAAFAIGALGVQFGNFGLNASNTYYLAQEPKLVRTVMGNTLVASLGVGTIGGLALWIFFRSFPTLAVVQGTLLITGLLWIPVGLTYLLCQSMLIALHRVTEYNLIDLANRVFTLCAICFVLLRKSGSPTYMMLAALSGQVLGAICSYARLSTCFDGLPAPSVDVLRKHLRVGFKAYLILFFSFLVLKADVLLVKWLLGAEQTGYYSVAASMADYVLLLPTTIGIILFPKLSAMQDATAKRQRAKYAAMGTALCLAPLLLVAAAVAHYAVRLLFGPAFSPAARAFIWLIPGIYSLGIEIVLVQFLNSIGYPAIVIWSWLVSCIANIGLNIYVIPHAGIVGASAVSSLTYSLTLVFIILIVKFGWYSTAKPEEVLHG